MTDENRRANARAEVRKARDALAAADKLIESGLYNDAVSRLYYAVFHMVSAVLLSLGVEVKSQSALQSLFAQYIVHPGLVPTDSSRRLAALFGLRGQADYNRHFEMAEPGTRSERTQAAELIAQLESVLRTGGVLDRE